jgi:hypothetical protein
MRSLTLRLLTVRERTPAHTYIILYRHRPDTGPAQMGYLTGTNDIPARRTRDTLPVQMRCHPAHMQYFTNADTTHGRRTCHTLLAQMPPAPGTHAILCRRRWDPRPAHMRYFAGTGATRARRMCDTHLPPIRLTPPCIAHQRSNHVKKSKTPVYAGITAPVDSQKLFEPRHFR